MSAGPVIAKSNLLSLAVTPIFSPRNRAKPPPILLIIFSVIMSPIRPSTIKATASFGLITTSCAFQVLILFASTNLASMSGLSLQRYLLAILSLHFFCFCLSPPRIVFLAPKNPRQLVIIC